MKKPDNLKLTKAHTKTIQGPGVICKRPKKFEFVSSVLWFWCHLDTRIPTISRQCACSWAHGTSWHRKRASKWPVPTNDCPTNNNHLNSKLITGGGKGVNPPSPLHGSCTYGHRCNCLGTNLWRKIKLCNIIERIRENFENCVFGHFLGKRHKEVTQGFENACSSEPHILWWTRICRHLPPQFYHYLTTISSQHLSSVQSLMATYTRILTGIPMMDSNHP